MCPPDHYGIEYEINPWMDRRQGAHRHLAMTQWQDLRRLLERPLLPVPSFSWSCFTGSKFASPSGAVVPSAHAFGRTRFSGCVNRREGSSHSRL